MSIREIPAAAITDAVEALCIEANTRLPADVKAALDAAEAAEPWPLAKETLGLLQQNLCVAKEKDLPICQDTPAWPASLSSWVRTLTLTAT